jgi:hypothetical protein
MIGSPIINQIADGLILKNSENRLNIDQPLVDYLKKAHY